MEVPFDLHRSIIGQKGRDVRELMNTYDVHIMLSPAEEKLDYIKVHAMQYLKYNIDVIFNIRYYVLFRFPEHHHVSKMQSKLYLINVKHWKLKDKIEL